MLIYQAIILGIVQGFTELLPISSSAHLYLIPWIFNWNITEAFDVALHFGTFLAIIIFFFKDWLNLIKGGVNNLIKNKTIDGNIFWYLVIATIPGAIIGFTLDHYLENFLKNPIIISIALIVMGFAMYLIDKFSKSEVEYEKLNLKQVLLIGISQALAFIPGVSRSGITITTGRALGIKRDAAAKISFMLSAPIVFAATIYKLKDFEFSLSFIIGVLFSFITGMVVIKFLLEYLKKGNLKIFSIYRLILGIGIIIYYFI